MFRIKKDGRKNDGKNDRTSKLLLNKFTGTVIFTIIFTSIFFYPEHSYNFNDGFSFYSSLGSLVLSDESFDTISKVSKNREGSEFCAKRFGVKQFDRILSFKNSAE